MSKNIFFSNPLLDPPICGDEFHFISGSGQLIFPQNRTLNYTTNIRCEWVIQVPPRFGVKISIPSIDIEYQKDCYADYLTFHDGTDSTARQIGYKVCGTQNTPIIKSTGYYMTVVFNSDEDIVGSGFILDWTIGDALKPRMLFVMDHFDYLNVFDHILSICCGITSLFEIIIKICFSSKTRAISLKRPVIY